MEPVNVYPCQNIIGEGPLWNVNEQAIYWVDIDGKKIQRFYPETGKYDSFDVPVKVCLMAFRENGGMIFGAEDGFYFWDSETQKMNFILFGILAINIFSYSLGFKTLNEISSNSFLIRY